MIYSILLLLYYILTHLNLPPILNIVLTLIIWLRSSLSLSLCNKQSKKTTVMKNNTAVPTATVILGTSTYHYFRFWINSILKDADIKASFVKIADSYNGVIYCSEKDRKKAVKVIAKYQKENNCVDLIKY